MRRAILVLGAVTIALGVTRAAAKDYTGWYLGAGIGYAEPMGKLPNSACTNKGGKIVYHEGKAYCGLAAKGAAPVRARNTNAGAK